MCPRNVVCFRYILYVPCIKVITEDDDDDDDDDYDNPVQFNSIVFVKQIVNIAFKHNNSILVYLLWWLHVLVIWSFYSETKFENFGLFIREINLRNLRNLEYFIPKINLRNMRNLEYFIPKINLGNLRNLEYYIPKINLRNLEYFIPKIN